MERRMITSGVWLIAVAMAFIIAVGSTILLSAATGPERTLRYSNRPDTGATAKLLGGLVIFASMALAAWSAGLFDIAKGLLLAMVLGFAVGFRGDLSAASPRYE